MSTHLIMVKRTREGGLEAEIDPGTPLGLQRRVERIIDEMDAAVAASVRPMTLMLIVEAPGE